jgi:hypothetical protein
MNYPSNIIATPNTKCQTIIIATKYIANYGDMPKQLQKGFWVFRNSDGVIYSFDGNYRAACCKAKSFFYMKGYKFAFLCPVQSKPIANGTK